MVTVVVIATLHFFNKGGEVRQAPNTSAIHQKLTAGPKVVYNPRYYIYGARFSSSQ